MKKNWLSIFAAKMNKHDVVLQKTPFEFDAMNALLVETYGKIKIL